MDTVFMDNEMAFIKVPHILLVNKIRPYRIVGDVLVWIEDWLINRKSAAGINL